MSKIIEIASVVKEAVHDASTDPKTSLVPSDANAVAKDITPKIERHVQKEVTAVLKNYTNNEPWYQSRVIIGLAVSLLLKIAIAAGFATETVDPESVTTAVMALLSALGDLYALYGRTVASKAKPIGS